MFTPTPDWIDVVKSVFEDPNIAKYGAGVANDMKILVEFLDVVPLNVIDLADEMADEKGPMGVKRYHGLPSVSEIMPLILDEGFVRYSALDAVMTWNMLCNHKCVFGEEMSTDLWVELSTESIIPAVYERVELTTVNYRNLVQEAIQKIYKCPAEEKIITTTTKVNGLYETIVRCTIEGTLHVFSSSAVNKKAGVQMTMKKLWESGVLSSLALKVDTQTMLSDMSNATLISCKSRLQERYQKKNRTNNLSGICYDTVAITLNPPKFKSTLTLGDFRDKAWVGNGSNKKEAEQEAAKLALVDYL